MTEETKQKIFFQGNVTFNDAKFVYNLAIKDVLEILDKWHQAYPEDVFTPLPKYGTPEADAQDNNLVTLASAHMGRHMSTKLREEVSGLMEDSLT